MSQDHALPASAYLYTPVAHAPVTDVLVLLAWTAAACAFTAWRFRWH